jgi:hypothetical protein
MELVPGVPITAYSDLHALAAPARLGLFVFLCPPWHFPDSKRRPRFSQLFREAFTLHAVSTPGDAPISRALGRTRSRDP